MASRGRGRGRGGVSFNKEQLNAIGVGASEVLPGPITEPSPLFPPLNRKPVPLMQSLETDYLLILKQDFTEHMQNSPAYMKMPMQKTEQPLQEINKLVAQLPNTKEKFNWSMYPVELRPKLLAKRVKQKVEKTVDIESRLTILEKIEEKTADKTDVTVKAEAEEGETEENLEIAEEQDEEMDDGTDYANNYFDNGEDYEDEDDNLDDGPCY